MYSKIALAEAVLIFLVLFLPSCNTRNPGQDEGYFSVTQTPDGAIYLTDGKIVYSFNLAWLAAGPG